MYNVLLMLAAGGWASLATPYWICLIVGGGLLIISSIAGGDADVDVDLDIDVDMDLDAGHAHAANTAAQAAAQSARQAKDAARQAFEGVIRPLVQRLQASANVDESELTFLALDTRTPYTAKYVGPDANKVAHYMLRWVNTRGQKGPWSETASATIGA